MPIPDLVDNVLPEGIHECTIEEIEAVFGRFQYSDRRMRLTEKLRQYLAEAKRSGAVAAVIVDGSYVTAKDEPEDIDLIVVLPADWVWPEGIRPFVYNAITRQGIRRMGYPFDVLTRVAGTASYEEAVRYFSDRQSQERCQDDCEGPEGSFEGDPMSDQSNLELAGLKATCEALGLLERSMYHLHKEKENYHPQQYAMMAEPTAEEILKLRAQIDELIGMTDFATGGLLRNPVPLVERWEKDHIPAESNGPRQSLPASSSEAKS